MNGQKRENVCTSLYPDDRRILGIWTDQTGMNVSEILRFIIREFSDHRFKKRDYGWSFEGPAFRKDRK